MTRTHRLGQAGANIEITEEMIEAGVEIYEEWEPRHVFEGAGGRAAYAIRELVKAVYLAMARNTHGVSSSE
jgi:hypothetical protein